MEGEDIINLPASLSECESGELRNSDDGNHEVDSRPNNVETKDGEIKSESLELYEGDVGYPRSDIIGEVEVDKTLADDSSDIQISNKIIETGRVEEKLYDISCGAHSESFMAEEKIDGLSTSMPTKKRHLDVQDGSSLQNHTMDAISSVKRARMTFDDQQPSVHIIYNFLTRASKQKLEELLQKWSEWEVEHGSSPQDQNEHTESGEETFFPAVRVGAGKPIAVSFWIDKQMGNRHDTEFSPLEDNIVPLYDRGYAGLRSADGSSNLEGGLEIKDDASRCFNCGSYSHSLKQCPRPRDSVAVNAARKQHKSKRNQNNSSCNAIRYFQSSQGGKYDDLKPGVLSSETQKILGLGESDPPPWLNRMREIGYPPGYLTADNEDQPSGISIFGDGETNDEREDGEITEMVHTEANMKMTVEFPGINAPIPVDADEKLWAPGPSSRESSRSRSNHRVHHHEQRHLGDFEDGPPGIDSRFSSSHTSRYDDNDSPYSFCSPRDRIPRPRSPTFGMSYSERGRRASVYEDFVDHGSYGSTPHSLSDRHTSPRRTVGSSRFDSEIDDRWNNSNSGYSSRSNSHRHHRRR